jgi:hypothetical protein
MDNKNDLTHKGKQKPDPAGSNYTSKINNKAHEKSPFGEDEPSNNTTFK